MTQSLKYRRRVHNVSFLEIESVAAVLTRAKRKADRNKVQSLMEGKVIVLPKQKTHSNEVDKVAHIRPVGCRCVWQPCMIWRHDGIVRAKN